MSNPYDAWNQDLLYSVGVSTTSIQIYAENSVSPIRPQRYRVARTSPLQDGSPVQLAPTMSRSPLQALKQTTEGFLYSPCRPRHNDSSSSNI